MDNLKVVFNQRRHVRPEVETHLLPGVSAPLLDPRLIREEKGLVCNDNGRRNYEPWYSESPAFRSGMRLVAGRKEKGEEVLERGKKSIRPAQNGNVQEWTEQRKHNISEYTRRSDECAELCVGFTKLRKFQARAQAASYDMEGAMNRKQRSGRSIEIMRNGIPVAVEGDRAFKDADREPGFYAKGGIIAGSTIQMRASNKGAKKGGIIAPTKKGPTVLLSYADKVRQRELDYEQSQVQGLTAANSKGGVSVPSFEERTQCWLVTPEMEKD